MQYVYHNERRGEHGTAPLAYNKGLADEAQLYALELANADNGLIHDESTTDGENLYFF